MSETREEQPAMTAERAPRLSEAHVDEYARGIWADIPQAEEDTPKLADEVQAVRALRERMETLTTMTHLTDFQYRVIADLLLRDILAVLGGGDGERRS